MTIDNVILGQDIDPDWGNSVADALNGMESVSYSPTLTGITIGNGTQAHRWASLGDWVIVSNVITFGTTTSFSGWPRIAPPVTLDTSVAMISQVAAADVAPGNNFGGQASFNGADQVGPYFLGASGLFSFYSATAPFTWATGDVLRQTYLAKRA
jgi:hypothetical protein